MAGIDTLMNLFKEDQASKQQATEAPSLARQYLPSESLKGLTEDEIKELDTRLGSPEKAKEVASAIKREPVMGSEIVTGFLGKSPESWEAFKATPEGQKGLQFQLGRGLDATAAEETARKQYLSTSRSQPSAYAEKLREMGRKLVPSANIQPQPLSPEAEAGRSAFGLSAITERALPPSPVEQKVTPTLAAAPEAPAPKAATDKADEDETPQAPKNAPEMTALEEEIAAMEKSHGEHGEALKKESEALMGQLAQAREAYDASVSMARSDYEEAKARQQWAQVAEIIGRSLVGLVAAKKSLQKGRDFTQGLDPKSQVDWLGQLRESRADLQERIDAAKREYEGEAQLAGEASKGRKALLEAAFEGKQRGFGERIRELRQAEGRQYEEGRTAEQRTWQDGRDKVRRDETIDEATRVGIRADVSRADAAAKTADLELDKWSKGLLSEGKLREESKAKLIEKLVGWGAGPEEATKVVEDQETSWYQKGHVKTGGLNAISSYAKKLPGYPERLDPRREYAKARQLSSEDGPTTDESSAAPSSQQWTEEDKQNAEEIQFQGPSKFKSGDFVHRNGKLYRVK